MSIQPGQVWIATGGCGQTAHYLTLELTHVELGSPKEVVPRWVCLCLDLGRACPTSLGTEGESSVTWERIA